MQVFDLEGILNSFFGGYSIVPVKKPSPAPSRGYLPDLELSEEFQKTLDFSYLEFLCRLYLVTEKNIPEKSKLWFAEEIAYNLRCCYPNLSPREYELMLQHIISMSQGKEEK